MKKLYSVIILLLLSFCFFIFILYNPKNYKIEYKVKDYFITEKYVKELELYEFYINHKGKTYPLLLELEYNKNRKNIKKIETKKDDKNCLYITIRDNEYPVCYDKNILVHHSLLTAKEDAEVKDKYKTITIYNYDNLDYYIWNYKGFDFISESENKTIEVFKNDNYENLLSYPIGDYLIFPNYDQKYYFEEMFILNKKNNKVAKMNLDEEISYFSNFIGSYKKEAYLLDKKNEKEYKINPKTKKIKLIGTINKNGIIYSKNKLEKKSLKTIINKNLTFDYQTKFNYELKEEKLYLNIGKHKVLISNRDVKEIIQVINDKIFYLSGDILFCFSPLTGEKQLLQNKEWNFNYQNKIFIFN